VESVVSETFNVTPQPEKNAQTIVYATVNKLERFWSQKIVVLYNVVSTHIVLRH